MAMRRFGVAIVLSVILMAAFAAGLSAAKRGISVGEWLSVPFSDASFAKRWGYGETNGARNVISADRAQQRNGKPTLRLDTNSGFDCWVYFPNTKDWDIDLSKAKVMRGYLGSENKNGWGGDPWIIFVDMAGRKARFDGLKQRLYDAINDWTEIVVPVGADLDAKCAEYGWKAQISPGFDWKHISCVQIHQDTDGSGYTMWYSGFEFIDYAGRTIKWWLSSINKPDLSVTYAEQVPQYKRYIASEPDPNYNIPELVGSAATEKHWPNEGEQIKYLVHIKNAGFARSKPTDFVCMIDGKVVKKASLPALAPHQVTTIVVNWKWKQGPYQFAASVDTKNKLDEITKKNNTLRFKTDAYVLAAVCEKSIVAPIEQVNNWYGSFCFEDWMRGATIDQLNSLFKRCKYDFAPNGAEVSVRLGKIFLVDELPDDGAKIGEIDKGLGLYIFDGVWHYPLRAIHEWCDLANDFDWALNHELSHQLGIIDDYQYDMGPDSNLVNHKAYDRGPGGIMGGGQVGDNVYPAYADVDIAGFNLTKGHRRGFFGEYLYCIPYKNTLVLSIDGRPLADKDIEIYQKSMYTGKIEAPPVFTGKTDAEGRFPLANRPVPKDFTTATGCTLHANPWGYPDVVGRNGLFLIRTQVDGKWYYGFIDIGRFVCEYARGHKDNAVYSVKLMPE